MKFQHFVMSADQLMIIDGQPTHQVIVNQTPVTYEPQPTTSIVAIPQQHPQTVYYMDNSGNVPSELAQVETVELQPIVLNHRLGSQISLVQRPAKAPMIAQQLSLMQQVQRVSSPKIARPQMSNPQLAQTQTVQVLSSDHQNPHYMRVTQQQKQEVVLEQPPSVTIERASQVSRQQHQQIMTQQFQRVVDTSQCSVPQQKASAMQFGRQITLDQIPETDKQEGISLSDGKVISVAEYKERLLKQHQRLIGQDATKKPRIATPNPKQRPRVSPTSNPARVRAKPVKKPQESISLDEATFVQQSPSQAQLLKRVVPGQAVQQRPPAQPQFQKTIPKTQPQQLASQVSQQTTPLQPQQSQQCPANQPQQTVHSTQQIPRQNNHNYLIQPPKHNVNVNKQGSQCPLPSCVPCNQIQKIIENTPVSEEYSDSIRMLVMLMNGEQRLITFTLPNQACTIQEILEQVGVPLQPDTIIDVTEANSNGINYIVTVGFYQNKCQSLQIEESTESMDDNLRTNDEFQQQPPPLPPLKEPSPEPVREPSPEPVKEVEQPKYIEGKMAVCGYCGILSDDFNKCVRCKSKLPENVKAIASLSSLKRGETRIQGIPIQKKIEMPVTTTTTTTTNTNGTKDLNALKKKTVTRGRNSENEPVILTLSSDEEEEPQEKSSGPINENILQKLGSAITLSPIKKEPSFSDIQKTAAPNLDGDKSKIFTDMKSVSLQCRTVRIGSYRAIPKDNVFIDSASVTVKVGSITNSKEIITIKIDRSEIVKILISFHKQLPVLFYYLRPTMGNSIREMLGMKENDANYYDPLSDNESHRRITLLPEMITEDAQNVLIQIYRSSVTCNILDELTVKEANDILIKTCPKELTLANLQHSAGSVMEVKPLFTYPPEGRGRISINTEDYMCLGSDQFLNDVIIDFYLKFLVNNLTPEEQERIHVFSTFFYKRLTTKPVKASRKSQPAELDPSLTPAEKRHARVKTWTKNIDLFKKDYVIVPINENCHWFLAIICFPGLEGCRTMDGSPIKIEIAPKKKRDEKKTTIGNVTITAVKKEEIPCEDLESDKDEAEGDESELESDDCEEPQTITSHSNRPPIQQPCILIFDSLAGTGRSRVVATLRDYLTCEYKTKYSKEKVFNKDVIKGACPKVPQQTNFTDCGLYLLQYVEHFFMEPIKDYYIPINSLKNWFDEITVTRKREDISILLRTLMVEYKKDVSLIPEIMFPTKNGVVVDQFADDEEMEDEMSDNEEFNSPPIGSETEVESSLSMMDEECVSMKPSCESASDMTEIVEQTVTNMKPDISELSVPKIQTSRDTLSYLKAKRIIRHKTPDSPNKRMKNSE